MAQTNTQMQRKLGTGGNEDLVPNIKTHLQICLGVGNKFEQITKNIPENRPPGL